MAGVSIQVLGCGDAFGSGGRFQTSFLVAAGTERCLIDCGSTTMVALRRLAIDPESIDAIFLSHLHGDHFGGLPFLLMEAHFAGKRERPLVIAGPSGTAARVTAALDVLFPGAGTLEWRFPLRYVELRTGQPTQVGGFELMPHAVVHPSGATAFAFRLECGGRVLAYSGDTEWTDTLIDVADAADLFITECYSYNGSPAHHLDYRTLSTKLDQLNPRRIMLSHMGPSMLDHLDQIPLETIDDGQRIDL